MRMRDHVSLEIFSTEFVRIFFASIVWNSKAPVLLALGAFYEE